MVHIKNRERNLPKLVNIQDLHRLINVSRNLNDGASKLSVFTPTETALGTLAPTLAKFLEFITAGWD